MRRFTYIGLALLLTLALSGCIFTLFSGDTIPITFTIENSTEFEITQIWLNSPPKFGSSSPIHDILESDSESMRPGEVREFTIKLLRDQIESGGLIYIKFAGTDDEVSLGTVYLKDDTIYEITGYDNDLKLTELNDINSSDSDSDDVISNTGSTN